MSIVSIAKWGNSLAIRVPRRLADELALSDGSKVSLAVEDGRLVARPRAARPRLADLVRRITPANRHTADETDLGGPVGNETW